MTGPLVSLIVPVLHDTHELATLLAALARQAGPGSAPSAAVEVIVVNGDASDESIEALRFDYPSVRWTTSGPGRAIQMNAGARLARGDWLLFLHADTRPESGWADEIQTIDGIDGVCGGAFRFALRSSAAVARIVEQMVGWRVRWLGLPYGDQGLVVRRQVFERLGGYRLIPLMEDLDLVRRLRRYGRIVVFDTPVTSSARRYERDGWLNRTIRNLVLLILYGWGVSPRRLARIYYRQPLRTVAGPGRSVSLSEHRTLGSVAVVMPALDEAAGIGEVLAEIPPEVGTVVVVDNGSTDATATIARDQGARVVHEPRRGYGRACLAGLDAAAEAEIVVFLDADRSDYPGDMAALVAPILSDDADLVMGCREGVGRPLSARIGTAVCVTLINWGWRTYYEDLGPFRAVRRQALDRLAMTDQTYGWTIEMQVKAAEANLRVLEVPIAQRRRLGRSKISGTLGGTLRAGVRMLTTIWSLWWTRGERHA